MSKILELMEKNGWRLCERWVDFDAKKRPVARFVKYLNPVPPDLKDRVTNDPREAEPGRFLMPEYRGEAPGLLVTTEGVLSRRPLTQVSASDHQLARLCGESVPVYVNLSVTDKELEGLEEARKSRMARWADCWNNPSPAATRARPPQAGPPGPVTPPTDRPLSLHDREKLNRKLMEANSKEQLKNKLRQDAIWGAGIMPRF